MFWPIALILSTIFGAGASIYQGYEAGRSNDLYQQDLEQRAKLMKMQEEEQKRVAEMRKQSPFFGKKLSEDEKSTLLIGIGAIILIIWLRK